MKTLYLHAPTLIIIVLCCCCLMTSCYKEDPGPLQPDERSYSFVDFDRVAVGEAFNVQIVRANYFSITANGDRRNLNDLVVTKNGNALSVRYGNNRDHQHQTYLRITMPVLHSANFFDACDSRITGFYNVDEVTLFYSDASSGQIDLEGSTADLTLSDASHIFATGKIDTLNVDVSGSSVLDAFTMETTLADITASGSSEADVNVEQRLTAKARDASKILYKGAPSVSQQTSGASVVQKN